MTVAALRAWCAAIAHGSPFPFLRSTAQRPPALDLVRAIVTLDPDSDDADRRDGSRVRRSVADVAHQPFVRLETSEG
jgi:hypothetical protein